MIRYLKHDEIDKNKWDQCIELSPNGLIYACSWYLDIGSPGWEALVEGDYEAIMPITFRKKIGFYYIFWPFLSQQLGVFSVHPVDEFKILQFINNLPEKFKYVFINLNYANTFSFKGYTLIRNTNYELKLDKKYEEVRKLYSKYNLEKVKKASGKNLEIRDDLSGTDFIKFEKENNRKYRVSVYEIEELRKIAEYSVGNHLGKVYGVFNNKNILIAAALFLIYKNRIIYLYSVSNKEGRESRAMFLLLDNIIKLYSGSEMIFDFEGSNIQNVAFFFKGFNARPVEYLSLKINKLPWFIRLIKR